MATICLVGTLPHRPCPPLSVCQTVRPSAWFGTTATRRVAVFLPPTAARSLCQTRTLPSSLPAQDLPPREPRTDSSGETVSAWGTTYPQLSSRLPPVPRIQQLDKEALLPEHRGVPFAGVWAVPRAGWVVPTEV